MKLYCYGFSYVPMYDISIYRKLKKLFILLSDSSLSQLCQLYILITMLLVSTNNITMYVGKVYLYISLLSKTMQALVC